MGDDLRYPSLDGVAGDLVRDERTHDEDSASRRTTTLQGWAGRIGFVGNRADGGVPEVSGAGLTINT